MDDIVNAALKKWPNVPACRGWLALDARGDWYMRDERVQAAGAFPQVKGSRIVHDKLREFIQRNYDADESGGWYFQNGPQRVYVELEAAPLVLGVERAPEAPGGFVWRSHTGQVVQQIDAMLLDEAGRLFAVTPRGLAIVRSLDMDAAADALEARGWAPQEVRFADLPQRYGYQLSPQAGSNA
ncbi:MAG: DUF2946 family protein [Leptothrix sp. (in: b-proteobacteria)]